jgi:hypothetical protein
VTGELIYSVELAVVRCLGDGQKGDGEAAGATTVKPVAVSYCDICRRWGAVGTTHVCWRNWHKRLSDLHLTLLRDGRAG